MLAAVLRVGGLIGAGALVGTGVTGYFDTDGSPQPQYNDVTLEYRFPRDVFRPATRQFGGVTLNRDAVEKLVEDEDELLGWFNCSARVPKVTKEEGRTVREGRLARLNEVRPCLGVHFQWGNTLRSYMAVLAPRRCSGKLEEGCYGGHRVNLLMEFSAESAALFSDAVGTKIRLYARRNRRFSLISELQAIGMVTDNGTVHSVRIVDASGEVIHGPVYQVLQPLSATEACILYFNLLSGINDFVTRHVSGYVTLNAAGLGAAIGTVGLLGGPEIGLATIGLGGTMGLAAGEFLLGPIAEDVAEFASKVTEDQIQGTCDQLAQLSGDPHDLNKSFEMVDAAWESELEEIFEAMGEGGGGSDDDEENDEDSAGNDSDDSDNTGSDGGNDNNDNENSDNEDDDAGEDPGPGSVS